MDSLPIRLIGQFADLVVDVMNTIGDHKVGCAAVEDALEHGPPFRYLQNEVSRRDDDACGASLAIGADRVEDRTSRADHVVVEQHGMSADLGATDREHLGLTLTNPTLGDHRDADAKIAGVAFHPFGASRIGRTDDERRLNLVKGYRIT